MRMTTLALSAAIAAATIGIASAAETQFDPQNFIANEIAAGRKEIVVPPGVYVVRPKEGQDASLALEDLTDVKIHMDGVEFRSASTKTVLRLVKCVNVKISGLVIDYDPLPFSQARVTKVESDGTMELELIEGYPTKGFRYENLRMQLYSPTTNELTNPLRYDNGFKMEDLGGGRLRISGGYCKIGGVGDIAVFNCLSDGRGCTIVSQDCKDVVFERVTLYGSPELGFLGQGDSNTTYDACVVDRRPENSDYAKRGYMRLRSLTADAFHLKDARAGAKVLNCTARYMGDDCINISGMYSLVMGCEGDSLRVLSVGKQLGIEPSDSLDVLTPDGKAISGAKALSVEPDGGTRPEEWEKVLTMNLVKGFKNPKSSSLKNAWRIKVDRELKIPAGSAVIAPAKVGNGFEIKNCVFGPIRSRAILIKASNGVITDNKIKGTWSEAIKIAPEFCWLEGTCSSNLTIARNVIDDCRAGIAIYGDVGVAGGTLAPNAHRDIVVEGNIIRNVSNEGIRAIGCENLVLKDNRIELAPNSKSQAIVQDNVVNTVESGNTAIRLESPK